MRAFELCWGTVQRAGLLDLLRCAELAGFGTVAVQPGSYLRLSPDEAHEVRSFLSAGTVRVNVVDAILGGLPGSPRPEQVPAELRAGFGYPPAQCFDVAQALGAPIVNVAHYLGAPVPLEHIGEAVGAIAAQAHARGLTITVEFIPGTGISDLAAAAQVVRIAAPAPVAIMLDTWHLARSGGGPAEVAALPPGMIGGLQLSDRVEPAPGTPYRPMQDRLLPGRGELPLRDILDAAVANNPDVAPGIEVFAQELRVLPPERAARSAASALSALVASSDVPARAQADQTSE